jgi:hypothetical protein
LYFGEYAKLLYPQQFKKKSRAGYTDEMKDNYIFIGVATVVVCVLIFLFGYQSFSNNPSPSMAASSPAATLVPFTKLVQGTQSTIPTRTNYIITSNED